MHQHLKSSYSLGLRQTEKDQAWQTLVANKAYGTFFTINGRFSFEEGTYKPNKCELFLQNYQGNVTIGIVSIKEEIQIYRDTLLDNHTLVLVVKLKALHSNNKLTKAVFIENNSFVNEFSKNVNLKVELIFDEIDSFSSENPNDNIFIDEARFLREGDDLVKPTYQRYNFDIKKHYTEFYSKDQGIGINSFELSGIKGYAFDDSFITDEKSRSNLSDLKKYILSNSSFIEDRQLNEIKNIFGLVTVGVGGYIREEDIYDLVTLKDSNGDVILSEKVIKPYPCAHNYIRFID